MAPSISCRSRSATQDLLDRVQRALARDAENRARLRHTDRIRERLASLSPREREVLDLVTQGKANKMVAGDLGVSQRTVEIHRAHVMQKMEAGSLAELVRMMMAVAPTAINPGSSGIGAHKRKYVFNGASTRCNAPRRNGGGQMTMATAPERRRRERTCAPSLSPGNPPNALAKSCTPCAASPMSSGPRRWNPRWRRPSPTDAGCLVIADDLREEPIDEFLQEARELRRNLPIFVITDPDDVAEAVSAMRHGATKVIEIPPSYAALCEEVSRAMQ